MKVKMKRILSILLSLVMAMGLIAGMASTALAYEGDPYASLVNTSTTVTFNGKTFPEAPDLYNEMYGIRRIDSEFKRPPVHI